MKYNHLLADNQSELPDQPAQDSYEDSVTTLELCRHIIDDLIDHGLTGLLLSSTHLRKYMGAYQNYAPTHVARTLSRIIANPASVSDIHSSMLNMFKGLYIEEACITNRQELLAALDAKFLVYTSKFNFFPLQSDPSSCQIESVELAWRYRVACAKGTQIDSK